MMCVDAIVNGKYLSTISELEKEIGGPCAILGGYLRITDTNCCLCPVDLELTAEKYNFDLINHPFDEEYSGESEFVAKEKTSQKEGE